MELFGPDDQTRIAAAIEAAEQETSGEIVAVVAENSGTYLYAVFQWAAVVALLVPWPLVSLTWWPASWIYLTQLGVFLFLCIMLFPMRVRICLVPRSVKHGRARRRAHEQFLAQNLHTTPGRTGVLIFVSVAERYAEIIADAGIDQKVADGTWNLIVGGLTEHIAKGDPADGMVQAITSSGRELAKHFPPGQVGSNELPNHLIILSD